MMLPSVSRKADAFSVAGINTPVITQRKAERRPEPPRRHLVVRRPEEPLVPGVPELATKLGVLRDAERL